VYDLTGFSVIVDDKEAWAGRHWKRSLENNAHTVGASGQALYQPSCPIAVRISPTATYASREAKGLSDAVTCTCESPTRTWIHRIGHNKRRAVQMLNWFRRLIDRRRERKAAVKKAQLALELKREHARAAARRRRERERAFTLEQARQVMSGTFVIADIETTGFSARHEILEIAAIRVAPAGEVLDEFSMLVRIQGTVPAQITALTGIRDEHVRHCGRPLAEALARFIAFCDR